MHSEFRNRIAALDTASLCDANPQIRTLDSGIRPVNPGPRLVGRALTVACDGDFLFVLKALHEAEEGDVLVITAHGGRAIAGELFATESLRRKLGGIVVDGAVRDSHRLAEIPLPVYSRFVHPRAGTANTMSRYHIPVECGGVLIHPGDVLVGDADGLLVSTVEELKATIPAAEKIQQQEAVVLEGIRQGRSIFEYLNFEEHYENCLHGRSSALSFVFPG
ncbi:MAG: RraA family protein [Longispora sp.]|nr:RraA family protein [Longispora sp. (in: high G+C Gram-positive bacteria)]